MHFTNIYIYRCPNCKSNSFKESNPNYRNFDHIIYSDIYEFNLFWPLKIEIVSCPICNLFFNMHDNNCLGAYYPWQNYGVNLEELYELQTLSIKDYVSLLKANSEIKYEFNARTHINWLFNDRIRNIIYMHHNKNNLNEIADTVTFPSDDEIESKLILNEVEADLWYTNLLRLKELLILLNSPKYYLKMQLADIERALGNFDISKSIANKTGGKQWAQYRKMNAESCEAKYRYLFATVSYNH